MNRKDVFIRDARAQDINEMVLLLKQLFLIENDFEFDAHLQRHGLAALLADHGRSIVKVAVYNRMVVGLGTVQLSISTAVGGLNARIEDVVVDSRFRGNGIGSIILDSLCAWAQSQGCARLQLLADHRNTKALDFYKSKGWEQTHMICLNSIAGTHLSFTEEHLMHTEKTGRV